MKQQVKVKMITTNIMISFSNLPICFVFHKGANLLRKKSSHKSLSKTDKELQFGRRFLDMTKQTVMIATQIIINSSLPVSFYTFVA